jgi:hypothetical protein
VIPLVEAARTEFVPETKDEVPEVETASELVTIFVIAELITDVSLLLRVALPNCELETSIKILDTNSPDEEALDLLAAFNVKDELSIPLALVLDVIDVNIETRAVENTKELIADAELIAVDGG